MRAIPREDFVLFVYIEINITIQIKKELVETCVGQRCQVHQGKVRTIWKHIERYSRVSRLF
jgi:hypothetical protein